MTLTAAASPGLSLAGVLPSPFFFLRHGESENNQLDLVNGSTDCPLTERGRDQAREAAALLAGHRIGRIFTSPLARARETAAAVAEPAGAGIDIVEGLQERHWGVLECQPRSRLTDYFMVPEGAESWETYRDRVTAALIGLALPARALLVGHAGTMRVLRHGLAIGDVTDRLPNAAPVRFAESADGRWSFEPVEQRSTHRA